MMFALLAAAAALAAPLPREEAARPAATAVETAALPTAPTAAAKPTRYCFLNVEEDHIMRGKVCMTRKQWLWRGVDPLTYIGRTK
ncbi:hypothetical protein [Sphingomonas sp. Leaf257]|jgi:hypothetical protein|uniref:hypothetical protein n=1 Tax=Sphingomonas sp. Leaf257 TaxID=1736309 RepID=UPI0006FC85C1|nr:hypothetical protein [Sphingomonas sp. Leaf257]KQO58547.1 hypothetical protein ASF14_00955 [Sphingomonas sp. Leaf257]